VRPGLRKIKNTGTVYLHLAHFNREYKKDTGEQVSRRASSEEDRQRMIAVVASRPRAGGQK
jgi:hypothetical protein